MELYLVRHGEFNCKEHLYGQIDGPLTNKGKQQAGDCSKYFVNKKIDKIFSSDLKRTIETANILNSKLNLKINLKAELREIYRGEWEFADSNNPKYVDFKSEWDKHEKDLPYPNGECGQDVLKRVSKLINSIYIKSNNKAVIFVTHGGVIRTLLSEYSGLDQAKRFDFYPGLCSITLIEIVNNKGRIIDKCNTDHLEITASFDKNIDGPN